MTKLYKRIRRLARELAKFGSVGAMAFVITAGFFNLFRHVFDWGPLTANGVATVIAATFAYFANRYWTFRHRDNSTADIGREYVLFFGLNAIGLAITQLFIGSTHYVLHLKGGLADNGALVVGTGFATMFRYYAYKRWVFRKPTPKATPVVAPIQVPEPAMAGHGPTPAAALWTSALEAESAAAPPLAAAPIQVQAPGHRIGRRASRKKPTGMIVAAGAVAAAVVVGGVALAGSDSEARKPAAVQTNNPAPSVSTSASAVDPQEVNLLPKVASPARSYRCDPNYRSTPNCVPLKFPKGARSARAKCRWLTKHGFKKIVVRGPDRHGLDKDKNGIACDR